jgi:hypothetical protein
MALIRGVQLNSKINHRNISLATRRLIAARRDSELRCPRQHSTTPPLQRASFDFRPSGQAAVNGLSCVGRSEIFGCAGPLFTPSAPSDQALICDKYHKTRNRPVHKKDDPFTKRNRPVHDPFTVRCVLASLR